MTTDLARRATVASASPPRQLRAGLERHSTAAALVVLAIPFAVVVLATRGLRATVPTFHGADEINYHLATITRFAHQLPSPDLASYPAAQTPLYHLFMAVFVRGFGAGLVELRAVNLLLSFFLAAALFRLLRRARGLSPAAALALTLGFELSPYIFAPSFILLTDNAALLLAVLCLTSLCTLQRAAARPVLHLLLVAVTAGAALATRQSLVWVVPLAVIGIVVADLRPRLKVVGVTLLALGLLPTVWLFVLWGGLVPAGSDPISCGLCTGGVHLQYRTIWFSVALLGLLGALVLLPRLVSRARELVAVSSARHLVAVVGVVAVLLALFPVGHRDGDAGYLWQVSVTFPDLLGTSLLFWLLVPLGAVLGDVLVRRAIAGSTRRQHQPGWVPEPGSGLVFIGVGVLFALSTVVTQLAYEKYFDPFVLLALLLLLEADDFRSWKDFGGTAALAVLSIGYASSFVL